MSIRHFLACAIKRDTRIFSGFIVGPGWMIAEKFILLNGVDFLSKY